MSFSVRAPGVKIWPNGNASAALVLVAANESRTSPFEPTEYRVGQRAGVDHVSSKPHEISMDFLIGDVDAEGYEQDQLSVVSSLEAMASEHTVVVIESDWSARQKWFISSLVVTSGSDALWFPAVTMTFVEYLEAKSTWSTTKFPRKIRKRASKKKSAPVVSGSGAGLLPTGSTSKEKMGFWGRVWGS